LIVTPYSVVVGHQLFRGLYCEDGGSIELWNVGILPQHYMASQSRRPRLETSPPWKARNSKPEIVSLTKWNTRPQTSINDLSISGILTIYRNPTSLSLSLG
jgi:hypothetical protein